MVRRTFEALAEEDDGGLSRSTLATQESVTRQGTLVRQPKRARMLLNRTEEACCSCTRHSTCRTDKCECLAAGRTCRQCECMLQCCNQPLPLAPQAEEADGFALCAPTSEEEEDSTPPRPRRSPRLTGRPPASSTPIPSFAPGDGDNDGSTTSSAAPDEPLTQADCHVADETAPPPLLTAPPTPVGADPGSPTTVDQKLHSVYGDHVHSDDGSHLDRGVLDNAQW